MKKLIILIAFLTTIPSYATCPIEDGGSCKVAEILRQPIQRTYSTTQPMVKEFGGKGSMLQPTKNDVPSMELRDFGPKTTDYSYSTNCQFGICNQGGTRLFNERKN